MLEQSKEKKKSHHCSLRSIHLTNDLHSGACPKHAQYWQYHRKVKINHSRYQRRAAVSTQNWCIAPLATPANGHIDSEGTPSSLARQLDSLFCLDVVHCVAFPFILSCGALTRGRLYTDKTPPRESVLKPYRIYTIVSRLPCRWTPQKSHS